ncbi:MAG: ATP-binding cassette domain-containing protein [Planctomycetota bacterium]|jgi:ATPase subunit of ABC transporter with duplicated ATPase domains
MARPLHLQAVTFGYDTAQTVILSNLTVTFPTGWTGIIGPNGAGKSTLLHLASGRLTPRSGQITGGGTAIVCAQRTEEPPPELDAFVRADDAQAHRLRGCLEVDAGWPERWPTLSHGERKRAQVGTALWQRPGLLALDEPTNHVDAPTRDALSAMLRSFRGVGLLVSHDRELLDALCGRCVFLEDGAAAMFTGGYSAATAQREAELDAARRAHDQARKEPKRLQRSAAARRHAAAQADSRRSKRGVGRKDHDAKAKIDAARVSGKDGQAGRLQAQLEGRLRQVDESVRSTAVGRRRTLGLTMRGERARRDRLWQAAGGELPLGGSRVLTIPELVIGPADRIGVRGPNGAGKSTLVRHIVGDLTLDADRIIDIPQEIDRAAAGQVLETLHRLPSDRRGDALSAVDSLGSDPARLLETDELSPGEVRKLVLAMGLTRRPHLIVMDEPTNHLDLPSIGCLEASLRECHCALLLVSHDQRFLEGLVDAWWDVERGASASTLRVGVNERPARG